MDYLLQSYWCLLVEVVVSASGIVKPIDVFEHCDTKFTSSIPALPIAQFDLYAALAGVGGVVLRAADGTQE